jgi:transcriptional regulator with XRE-family HTH domain
MPAKDRYAAIGMDSRAGQPNPSPHPNSDREAPATDLLDAWVERGDIVLLTRAEPHESEELTVEQLLGRAILRLRLYFGWSQRELGRRARLHQSTISRVERGKQAGLSLKRLFAICRALRVVDVDLVTRKPSVPPTELETHAQRRPLGPGSRGRRPQVARRSSEQPGNGPTWHTDAR